VAVVVPVETMPKKLPRDVNARAFAIGELATGKAEAWANKGDAAH